MQSQTSFTQEDIDFLSKDGKKKLILVLVLFFVTLFSLGVVYFIYKYQGYITYDLYLKISLFELVCSFFVIFILSRPYIKLKKDLEEKIKTIYTGKITDKKEDIGENSATYYLFLEEGKFIVDKNQYEQFNVGDEIVLEQASQSKVVLNINKKI